MLSSAAIGLLIHNLKKYSSIIILLCFVLSIFTNANGQGLHPSKDITKIDLIRTGNDNDRDDNKENDNKENGNPSEKVYIEDDRCGTVIHNDEIRKKYGEPSIQEFEKWMSKEQKNQKSRLKTRSIITIPVVVHVIHNGEAVGGVPNISEAQILSQIDVLNEDFRRMNVDASNTPADFIGDASDVEIEFCLATIDPQGSPTSGITRYNGNQSSYSREYMKHIIQPNTIWHPEYYFNIWCAPLQGDLVGFAQFPSNSALPGFGVNEGLARTDGVVVRDVAFGRGGSAVSPIDLGRIATHEVGHFFGLRHIGGDGGCATDDFCADTPSQDGQNTTSAPCIYDPTAVGAPLNDCDEGAGDLPDQFMNYMDYSNDACMNLFTNDQKSRMDVVLAMSPRRASLVNSTVCSGVPPETVFDPFPYAPANDLCFNAETIDSNETKSGNILYASPLDIPTACEIIPNGVGVWFRFTGDGKDVNLSLCDSGFDTQINVYSGDCSNLVCVAGNDNSCGLQSNVLFLPTLGVEYYVYVSGYNGATGVYNLTRTGPTALGSSSNIYSSFLSSQNQVYANDSLNLVAFIHRQDVSVHGGTETGLLRYDISTDGGLSFNNNVGILNTQNTAARYPQITGYNATNSTNPLDQKFVWTAPRTQGGGWDGMINGTSDITTASPVTSTEELSLDTESVYFGSGLCQGLPGEFWSFDRSYSGGNLTDSVYIQKGVYNSTSENVDWAIHKWIEPDLNLSFDGQPRIRRPNISFSPNGTIGWAAFLGDLVGGQDSTWSPVFVKTTDGGVTWGQPLDVNLNTLEVLDDSPSGSSTLTELLQENTPLPMIRPTCAFEFDITVDHEGNPHMFVVVGNSTNTDFPTPEYTIFSALPLYALDIFSEDGGLTWKAHQVAPINNHRLSVGATNPTNQDNYPQISRTSDGTYIFYSWIDVSDVANPASQARMAAQRLSDNFFTCAKWIENGIGYYPTMAPEVLINEAGNGYHLPIVNSQLSPSNNTGDPTQYRYLGNEAIIYESDFLYDSATIGYASCNGQQDEFGYTYVDCNTTTFSWIDITTNSEAVQVSGLSDDNATSNIPIGFDFTYYWNEYSELSIGSNGWISFDNDVSTITACFDPIPTAGRAADNYLAPFLADLNFAGTGNPAQAWYWSNQIDTFIVTYIDVPYWTEAAPGYAGSNTFQIILTAADKGITFQYLDLNGFTPDVVCERSLQIGMEDSNGRIGIQLSAETPPDNGCAIKISYPESVTYELNGAAILWNQNESNFAEIIDIRKPFSLRSSIENLGTEDLANQVLQGQLINTSAPVPVSIFETVDMIPPLTPGQDTILTSSASSPLGDPGSMTLTVDLVSNTDANLTNNSKTTEILAIDCLEDVVTLDYSQSDVIDQGVAIPGGPDIDQNGFAVYYNPPGSGFILDSVELIVSQLTSLPDQTITVKIFAYDGISDQPGNLMFETDLLGSEYPVSAPFAVPVGPLVIDDGGFLVYFGGVDGTSLGRTTIPPYAQTSLIVLDGILYTNSILEVSDLQVKAFLSPAGNVPIAQCKNIEVELIDGIATVTGIDLDNGSSTHCDVPTFTIAGQETITFDNTDLGYNLVTLEVADIYGNQQTCISEVNVLKDLCEAGDDAIDSDGGGLPDACDCSPLDDFNDNIILRNSQNPGMDFDGTDDYLTIPNDNILIPTTANAITFEAWIKPGDLVGIQHIASSGNTLIDFNFRIFLDNTKVKFETVFGISYSSINNLVADEWTHIAIVMENNDGAIYINGQLDIDLTISSNNNNVNAPILIGKSVTQEVNLFSGQMEEVRFWNSARTTEQIQLLKDREVTGTEANLSAYYSFNDGQPEGDNTALTVVKDDTSNGFDADLINMTQNGNTSNWINAQQNLNLEKVVNQELLPCITCPSNLDISMDFDGIDDHIIMALDPLLLPTNSNSVTFETWIKPRNEPNFGVIASSGISPNINYMISLLDDKLMISGIGVADLISNTNINLSQWTHIAVVFDKTETRLYINGVLDNTRVQPLGSNNFEFDFGIGAQANGLPETWNYEGRMDEIRYWTVARTAGQIAAYMNLELFGDEKGLAAYYNFSGGSPDEDNSDILVVSDQTTNERDGTLNGFAKEGTSSNWVSGSVFPVVTDNAALYFDGIDDYLSTPNQPDLIPTGSNSLTIEAWVYPEHPAGTAAVITSSGNFPSFNHQVSLFDGTLFIDATANNPLLSIEKIPNFSWTHIAIVFDETETRLYINGVLDNTKDGSFGGPNQGFEITWGSQQNGTINNFLGKIDEIRTWNYARNAKEIYNNILLEQAATAPGLIAYYDLNNGIPSEDNTTITMISDGSTQGNDATINGFAKIGSTSNWVDSPITYRDSDLDGKPDNCDNCIASKNLVLDNQRIDGEYSAQESITLGDNLTILEDANLTFRTTEMIIPHAANIPINAIMQLILEVCKDE